jgi:hypothetical protein
VLRTLCAIAVVFALPGVANTAITVPGANGSDGAFNAPLGTVTTIDLSLAAPAPWDSNSPTPGRGVYDGDQWAVVFHYTSVNIPSPATVAFKNNAARAPVIWLVSGDVTISGTLDLNGGDTSTGIAQSEPGPGGWPGGKNEQSTGAFAGPSGPGWGLGGGGRGLNGAGHTGIGSGTSPGAAYGSAQVIPLFGGSGGGGALFRGGAGGGAILIAATGTITINAGGIIRSNGGQGSNPDAIANRSGGGSGGAIRLVANAIAGSGAIQTLGATGHLPGSNGRIRIEANSVSPSITTNPLPAAARPATPAQILPDPGAPSARILTVAGNPVASQPGGQLNAAADVLPDILPATMPVVIETRNVPISSQVRLRVAPLAGDAETVTASFTSGNGSLALWTATIVPSQGSSALQVRVEP